MKKDSMLDSVTQKNVLEFPRSKSYRLRSRQRFMQQRGMLLLSIMAILVMTVVGNQFITNQEIGSTGSRSLASLQGFESQLSSIKWEHELAREYSRSEGKKGHLAVRPTLKDEMLYGALEGRYGIKLHDNRVVTVEFLNQAGLGQFKPIKVIDRASFLTRYADNFAISYSMVSLVESEKNQERWNLLSSDRRVVGQAIVELDQQGSLVSIHIQ